MARGYRYRNRQDARFYTALVIGVAAALAAGSSIDLPLRPVGRTTVNADQPAAVASSVSSSQMRDFGMCHSGGGTNCVVDGDTFWMDGAKIRIADIDAPETHPARCAEEDRLGTAATLRLRDLLNAGPVELAGTDRDIDAYERKLRIVTRNGVSLGATLVEEGLARPWEGRRRPWCGFSA